MPVTDFKAGADSAGFDLLSIEEANWGQVPAGPPTMNTVRLTGHSLSFDKTTQRSNEVGSDRQIADRILTSLQAGGDTNWELSLDTPGGGHLVDFFEGALFGTWAADLGIGPVGIDATVTVNQFDDPLAAGTMFANVVVGQWIRTQGFTNSANNGYFQVIAKPDNDTITVDGTLVTEVGSGDETVSGRNLRIGSTAHSYVLELAHTDISPNVYAAHLGMMISSMTAAFVFDSIITGTFSWLGKERQAAAATSVGDGSPAAKSTNNPANTITQMGFIREAGATPSVFVRSINLNLDNGLRLQRAISGGAAAVGMGLGDADVTGDLEAYFKDKTLMDKYDAHTPTQVDWRITEAGGQVLIVTVPEILLSAMGIPVQGPNNDILQSYSWEAKKDPTDGYSLQFDWFAA